MTSAPASRDLTPSEVEALAAALRLSLSAEDLPEVTHRLNAFLDALGRLGALPLADVEPLPVTLLPEATS